MMSEMQSKMGQTVQQDREAHELNKKANENLPQDLQDTINTFIEQANIVEEYDLDTMPMEYFGTYTWMERFSQK